MAFLDNSGDIILDAVLTDAGRKRLAAGNGSFRITKYAFGDDEINYGNYDTTSASGSAYYDLQILQTPVLEAFTNNTATMKSKLISLTNNNILYLPVIIVNTQTAIYQMNESVGSGSYVVTVDGETSIKFQENIGTLGKFIDGNTPSTSDNTIRVDQGLNTTQISDTYKLDAELTEYQYIVEIDNRFGSITDNEGGGATYSFVDDDNIASYYLSQMDVFVYDTPPGFTVAQLGDQKANSALAGPRGTNLQFRIAASTNLMTNTYLFEQLGGEFDYGSDEFYYLDTTVRITGATTGYKIDIPVRFVKCKSCA